MSTPSPIELVRAAVLAPSPDNNQPWLFASRDDELLVYLDPARTLPSDVNSMFDLMGIGATIENAAIAARQSGFEMRTAYAPAGPPDSDGPRLVATLALAPGTDPDPLYPHLAARCTCRKPYSRRSVPEAVLAGLAEAARRLPEIQLDWITDRARIRAFARVVAQSDQFRFQYEPFHNEIFRQLRFTAEEAQQTGDGMDFRTLELPPGTGFVLPLLRPWSRMKWVHRLHLTGLLTAPSAVLTWRSGALGLISIPEPAPSHFLNGGRAFQRLWLAAQAAGLALQPLGSLPILLGQMAQLGGRKLNLAHQRLSRRLDARLRELVPTIQNRTLLMLFRLGHATPPRVRSLRRNVEEVFLGGFDG